MVGYQLDESKSLFRKWVEITQASIRALFLGYQSFIVGISSIPWKKRNHASQMVSTRWFHQTKSPTDATCICARRMVINPTGRVLEKPNYKDIPYNFAWDDHSPEKTHGKFLHVRIRFHRSDHLVPTVFWWTKSTSCLLGQTRSKHVETITSTQQKETFEV